MSCWCPDLRATRLLRRLGTALVIVAASATGATAADWTVSPEAAAGAETNTNRDLSADPADEVDSTGLYMGAGLFVGAATPRSDTLIRPRIRWNRFNDTRDRESVEGSLLLRNDFRTQRSLWSIVGRAAHQDWFNSELPDAAFDPDDPDDPTVPDSGQSSDGGTRDRGALEPRLEFLITPRVGIGGGVYYEVARYDADNADIADSEDNDYDYGRADAFLTYRISERTKAEFGPYATRYETSDDALRVDSYGANVKFIYDWSEQFKGTLALGYVSNDIEQVVPVVLTETTSGWHALMQLDRIGEINHFRAAIGRRYSPSGRGVVTTVDEARLQFDRDLTQRATLVAAARYVQSQAIGELDDSGDYDYFRGEVHLRYRFTPAWFVSGGIEYSWRERDADIGDADNESVFLRVGYQPPHRSRRLPAAPTTDKP
jgi:hypothetical protein